MAKRKPKMKEYTAAVAIQSLKSKVPTDFRFEETKICIDLSKIVWFKEYFHVATDKFKSTHTEVLLFGQSDPIILVIGYEDLKKDINKKNKK